MGRRVVVTEVKLAAILGDERQHEGRQPAKSRKCPVDEFAGFAPPFSSGSFEITLAAWRI